MNKKLFYTISENGTIFVKRLATFIPKTTVDLKEFDKDINLFQKINKYISLSFIIIFTTFFIAMLLEILLKIDNFYSFVIIRIIGIIGICFGLFGFLHNLGTLIFLKHKYKFYWINMLANRK